MHWSVARLPGQRRDGAHHVQQVRCVLQCRGTLQAVRASHWMTSGMKKIAPLALLLVGCSDPGMGNPMDAFENTCRWAEDERVEIEWIVGENCVTICAGSNVFSVSEIGHSVESDQCDLWQCEVFYKESGETHWQAWRDVLWNPTGSIESDDWWAEKCASEYAGGQLAK